jgi:hypothetical protein
MQYAPIVVFIYNRPHYLRRCLESLAQNPELKASKLIFFADGAKENATPEQLERIAQTRAVTQEKAWSDDVRYHFSDSNMGPDSIIFGVRKVLSEYGKAIVLEDDLILSKHFLAYMNEGLQRYEHATEVKQIGGFLQDIRTINPVHKAFFMPLTTTWGWATWERAWTEANFQPNDFELLENDAALRKKFNLGGAMNYVKMLQKTMGKPHYDSWDIRFWWSVFKTGGVVLYPDYSLVQLADEDLSGTHKSNFTILNTKNWTDTYAITDFPIETTLNAVYFEEVKTKIGQQNTFWAKIYRRVDVIWRVSKLYFQFRK